MPNILVIGSLNMDLVTSLRRMPTVGETIHAEGVTLVPGGKGGNAAVAAARLGAEVRFVGCVGDDMFGRQLRAALKAERIDCTHLHASSRGTGTGTATILLDRETGQSSIIVNMGANGDIEPPEDEALYAWADVVLLQLEIPMTVNVEVARRAATAGATVILDPAPATPDVPDELLAMAHIVSPNQSELALLTGSTVHDLPGAEAAARVLLRRGAEVVVVKLGDQGALWVDREKAFHAPAAEVRVVDTTAAGDAFTGALAVGLAQGLDAASVMQHACVVGALTCMRLGAQPSIPTHDEVQDFMTQHAMARASVQPACPTGCR